jgi:hypothetical protein
MKQILLLAFLTLTTLSFSQKIKLKVNGQKDTTVFLIKYYGKNLLYADTAEMKGGLVEFDGKKQKAGIVGLLLPGQKYFEFIYNNEEIQLETTGPDFVNNMKVKKSAENLVFIDYIKYINSERQKANDLVAKRDPLKKTDEAYKALSAEIDSISSKVHKNNVIRLSSAEKVGMNIAFYQMVKML